MNVDGGPIDRRVRNWNHLLTSESPFQVKSIRIIESDIFMPQTISFPRVLALVGLHGTGKTLLLRLLEAAFGLLTAPARVRVILRVELRRVTPPGGAGKAGP